MNIIQSKSDFPDIKSLPNEMVVDTEIKTDGRIEGYSVAYYKKDKIHSFYCPIMHRYPEGFKYKNFSSESAKEWLVNAVKNRKIIMHNASFDMWVLKYSYGIDIEDYEDTMIAHWCLDTERDHGLKDIMKNEYKRDRAKYKTAKEQGVIEFFKYAEMDAVDTFILYKDLMAEFKKHPKTEELYRKYELPFIRIIQHFNYYDNKIRIDKKLLSRYKDLLQLEVAETRELLIEKLGDINFNSSKQLAGALEKVGYKVPVKESTGNPTLGEGNLIKLYEKKGGLVLKLVLYWRAINKLDNTYVSTFYDRLVPMTFRKEKVHVIEDYEFLHHGTRTGRLSSKNPNLQNQPKDPYIMTLQFLRAMKKLGVISKKEQFLTEDQILEIVDVEEMKVSDNYKKYEKEILHAVRICSIDMRKIFIPMPGKNFIGADYSQLELRMMGHLSKDKMLIKAFKENRDLHQFTADEINKLIKKFTDYVLKRRQGKGMNFKIQYGGYYTTIARDLGIPVKVAKIFYDAYNKLFAGRTAFVKKVHSSARKSHYVQTLLGRRRNMHSCGINSHEFSARNWAENSSISTIVSGSSSDLIKIAMLNLWKYRHELNQKIQVHDELLFEVDEDKTDKYKKIVYDKMKNAITLVLPVEVDVKSGKSWREVH